MRHNRHPRGAELATATCAAEWPHGQGGGGDGGGGRGEAKRPYGRGAGPRLLNELRPFGFDRGNPLFAPGA